MLVKPASSLSIIIIGIAGNFFEYQSASTFLISGQWLQMKSNFDPSEIRENAKRYSKK